MGVPKASRLQVLPQRSGPGHAGDAVVALLIEGEATSTDAVRMRYAADAMVSEDVRMGLLRGWNVARLVGVAGSSDKAGVAVNEVERRCAEVSRETAITSATRVYVQSM